MIDFPVTRSESERIRILTQRSGKLSGVMLTTSYRLVMGSMRGFQHRVPCLYENSSIDKITYLQRQAFRFLGGVALDYQMGVSPRTIALRVLCALNGLSTGAMCFGVETARLEEYAPY